MNPLVTIGIPTCHRLAFLKEAVASALAQSYGNIEVLVSDDAAAEAVGEWARTVAERDSRLRYRSNERRLGLAGNWNALADAARGEFIVIIGDDDRLLPEFVGTLVKAIEPGRNVAFCNHYLIDESGRRLESESVRCTQEYGRHLLRAGEIPNAAASVWRNSVPMSGALIRTVDVRSYRFKEDLNTPELELFVRMSQDGARFVFVPDYLSEYRTHQHSATSAGLMSEKLALYLMDVRVAPDIEEYKRACLAPLLVNAVSRCLQKGEHELARSFLSSNYYPRPQWNRFLTRKKHRAEACAAVDGSDKADTLGILKDALRSGVQELCSNLPARVGCPVYRMVQRIKVKWTFSTQHQ